MVKPRTNDAAVEAFCPKTRLRFLYADVSATARRLAKAHGDSPAAAAILGKVLAGTAAATIDFNEPGERLVVAADVKGPLGGWRAEISGEGFLTGSLQEHDPQSLRDAGDGADEWCGPGAAAKATRLREDGTIRSQVSFECKDGAPESVYAALFCSAVPTRLRLVCTMYDGEVDRARALALQLVHEGSRRAFKRVERLFDDGTVADTLAFDATLPTLREILGVEDLVTGPTRAIAFGCTCSEKRFLDLDAYAALPRETLEGMLRPLRPREERCHLCGRRYTITPEQLVQVLQSKTETK